MYTDTKPSQDIIFVFEGSIAILSGILPGRAHAPEGRNSWGITLGEGSFVPDSL